MCPRLQTTLPQQDDEHEDLHHGDEAGRQMLSYANVHGSFAGDLGQRCILFISAGDGASLAAEAVGFTLKPVLQTLLSYLLMTSSPQLMPMSSARLVSS